MRRMSAKSLSVRRGLMVLAIAVAVTPTAFALTATWDGNSAVGVPGDGSNWSDSRNWTVGGVSDVAPSNVAPGDDISFGGGTVGVINLGGNRVANSIDFTAGFTLDSAGSPNTLTISSAGVSVDSSASATINAIVAGTSLTKSGAGTLVLGGLNTYTGATNINGGTLRVGTALTVPPTSAVTIAAGATFDLQGMGEYIGAVSGGGNLTLGSGGQIVVGALNIDSSFSGVISGGPGPSYEALGKNGFGTLVLSGNNTFAGDVYLDNAGTLAIASDTNLGAAGNSVMFRESTTTLETTAAMTLSHGLVFQSGVAGVLEVDKATTTTLSGVASGAGSLVKTGAGTLILGGTNTYAGGTTISAGMLAIGSDASLGQTSGQVVMSGFGALEFLGATTSGRSYVTNGADDFNVATGQTATLNGAISGVGNWSKDGAGTLILSGVDSAAGDLSVSAGTLSFSGNNRLSNRPDVTVSSGATLDLNSTQQAIGALSGSGSISLGNGTLTVGGTGNTTFSGVISGGPGVGTTGLAKDGTGVLVLAGINTFSGGVDFYGSMSVSADANLGNSANVLGFYGGTLNTTASFSTTRSIVLPLYGTIDVNSSTTLSDSGVISGIGSLTKAGAGTLILSGVDSITGDLNVSAGTLSFSGNNLLSNRPDVTVSSGATLDLNSTQQTVGSLSGSGNIVLGSGTLTAGGIGDTTFSGVISGGPGDGTTALGKDGNGVLELAGINTFTGGVDFYGSIRVSADANLGNSANKLGFYGGTLNTTASFSTSRNIVLVSQGTLDVNSSTTLTESGVISGTGALTKAGAGTLILSAASIYSGSTTINSGTIQLGSALALQDSTVQLNTDNGLNSNGIAATIGGLSGSGNLVISGSSLAIGNNNASTTYGGAISGVGNSAGLIKIGTGTLALGGSSTYTGTSSVQNGMLSLAGLAGALIGTASVSLAVGGTLQLDNRTASGGNTNLAGGRVNDAASVQFSGGTLSFLGADNTASTETFATAQLISGASTISLTNGVNGTTAVTFAGGLDISMRQAGGATLNFAAANLGTINQVFITGQSPGFIAGWATVDNGAGNDANFAKYSTAGGVMAMSGNEYTADLTSSGHVRLTGPTSVQLSQAASIANLSLDNRSGSVSIDQAGFGITLNQGGLLSLGSQSATIGNGTLTSGRTDGEIDAYVQTNGTLQVNSQIIDNGATATSLVKSGGGKLVLGNGLFDTAPANTFTGSVYVHQGILELNKHPGTIAIAGRPGSKIVIDGGTLALQWGGEINPNIPVFLQSGALLLSGGLALSNSLTVTGGSIGFFPNPFLGPGPQPSISVPVLNITGNATSISQSTLVVNGPSVFSGNSPTLQLAAGDSNTPLGYEGGPAIMQLGGDVTANPASGTTAGILSGPVSDGQTPGVLDLGGARNFQISSGSFVISASVTDGSISLSGGGTLALQGANTYAGGTTINSGTVLATAASSLGGSSSLVTFSGGTLKLQSDAAGPSFPQPLTTSAGTSSSAGGSINVDVEPILNTTAGAFAMSTVTLGSALNVTGSAGGSISFTGMTLQNGTVAGNASPTAIHNAVNVIINGVINQTGANGDILKDGPGTLTFGGSSSNTYTGLTAISGGMLVLHKTSGVAVPGNLSIFGGGTVQLAASNQIATNSVVTLDAVPSAVLDLNGNNNTFGNTNGTTFLSFVAGGTLTTGTGKATLGGDVQFTGTSGTAAITGNLGLGTAGRTFNIARGSSSVDMQVSANITGGPASGAAITKTGAGILSLSGADTYTGGTTVTQGTLQLASQTALPVNSALSIDDGAAAAVSNHGSGAKTLLQLSSLSFLHNGTGQLDLSNNDMILKNTSAGTVFNELKSGFNASSGCWNGTSGVISSAAAADTSHLTTLGDRAGGTAFDSVNTTANDMLVKYTYYGDANLDGVVNGADYQQIDGGFGQHLTGWSNGDFNYDGIIDGSDYSLIDNTFNQISASGASPLAQVADASDLVSQANTAVPEPASLGLVVISVSGLLCRRRPR